MGQTAHRVQAARSVGRGRVWCPGRFAVVVRLDLTLICRAHGVPQVYVCPPDACYLNGVECVGHEYWKKGVASCVDPKAEGGLCRAWERMGTLDLSH